MLETTARVSHAQFNADFSYGIMGGGDISVSYGRDLLGTGYDMAP